MVNVMVFLVQAVNLDGLVPADVCSFHVATEERGYDPGRDEEKRGNSSIIVIVIQMSSSQKSSSSSHILIKMNSSSMLSFSAGCV